MKFLALVSGWYPPVAAESITTLGFAVPLSKKPVGQIDLK